MQNWIKCSERMPEDGQYVLVFEPSAGVQQIAFFFTYGEWWDAAEENGAIHADYFTHWQPLPEPPNE